MADDSTPSEPTAEDRFGPPHGHQISDSLQLWILIPGALAIVVVVGEKSNFLSFLQTIRIKVLH